jgi:peptidoglycan hydrolase CwlO-like protein
VVRSHPRRLLVGVAFAGLAALAAVTVVSALPATLRAASTQLLSAREQAQRLADEIAGLDGRIDAAVRDCAEATDALHSVRRQIRDTSRLQKTGRQELQTARVTLADRAVALYKHDDISTLDAILSAGDFAEMVDQLALVQSVARADRQMLRAVESAQRRLERRAARLAADARTAEKLVKRRDRQLATIRAQLGERQALLDSTRADIRRLAARQTPAAPSPGPTVAPPEPSADGGGGGDAGGEVAGGQGQWWPLIEQAAAVNGVSAKGMYRLMMVESRGYASIVGPGGYYGLFQYAPSTWKGSWNPYRSHSITDGAAQIHATALALKMGYGHAWWDPSYSWAFGGG